MAHGDGAPVWDVVETWLAQHRQLAPRVPLQPRLIGIAGDPGYLPPEA